MQFQRRFFAFIRLVLSIAFEILIPPNPFHIKLEKREALLLQQDVVNYKAFSMSFRFLLWNYTSAGKRVKDRQPLQRDLASHRSWSWNCRVKLNYMGSWKCPAVNPAFNRDLTIRQRRRRRGTFLLPVAYCAWVDFWDGGFPARADVNKPCLTLHENVGLLYLTRTDRGKGMKVKNETLRLNLTKISFVIRFWMKSKRTERGVKHENLVYQLSW